MRAVVVLTWIVGGLLAGCAGRCAYRRFHQHHQARRAVAALVLGVVVTSVGLLMSTTTRPFFRDFLTSPGLGGLAAALAGAWALFSVLQQLKTQRARDDASRDERGRRHGQASEAAPAAEWVTQCR